LLSDLFEPTEATHQDPNSETVMVANAGENVHEIQSLAPKSRSIPPNRKPPNNQIMNIIAILQKSDRKQSYDALMALTKRNPGTNIK